MTYLSIVIPAFNEERRIGPTLLKLQEYLARQPYTAEIVVADDGSTDATRAIASDYGKLSAIPLRVLQEPHRGKGGAVRSGMLAANGAFRFLCDADLAMPVEELSKFLPPLLTGADVAIGSREAPGARRYNEPPYRHVMGRVFNFWVRLLTVRGISDTQCGFKCFTAATAASLFPELRLEGFSFDVEVLFLAQKSGLQVVEVPINWYHQQESKVRPLQDTQRMLRDAWLVRWRYQRGQYRLDRIRGASVASRERTEGDGPRLRGKG